jgi:uncharacterized protein (DUF885 family)
MKNKGMILFLLIGVFLVVFAQPNTLPDPENILDDKTLEKQLGSLNLSVFFDTSYLLILQRNPDRLRNFPDCFPGYYPFFSCISDDFREETTQLEKKILELLLSHYDQVETEEELLSFSIYEWLLKTRIEGDSYRYNEWQINGYGSWDYANRLLEGLLAYSVHTLEDMEQLLFLISRVPDWTEDLLDNLRARESSGYIPPVFLLDSAIVQLEYAIRYETDDSFTAEKTDIYRSLVDKIDVIPSFDANRKNLLINQLKREIEHSFIPSFLKLRNELIRLKNHAPSEGNCCFYPNGKDYYAYLLKRYTGTSLSPEELFSMGIEYLDKLQSTILSVAGQTEYGVLRNMDQVEQMLNDSFQPLEERALRSEYERILAAAKEKAKGFFNLFPTRDVVLFVDKTILSPAYYQFPEKSTDTPGQMIVNLVDPGFSSLYTPVSLVNHETIPGHHVQLAFLLDKNVSLFRNLLCADVYLEDIEFQGYMEGWALYAQWLGWEMGLYNEDSDQVLRLLRLMLNQGVRMVAEIGIHYYGWSREEAADYCRKITGRSYKIVQMNRFFAIPGQAVCYNFGVIEILRLKQYALEKLGERFDIREFHDVLLRFGPIPIGFLKPLVEEWVAEKR